LIEGESCVEFNDAGLIFLSVSSRFTIYF